MNKQDLAAEYVDIIIIGAGAAGLGLLLELDNIDDQHSVKVLEQKHSPINDRIWSFWRPTQFQHKDALPNYLQALIAKEWSQWSLSTNCEQYMMRDSQYHYCSIRAENFSELALSKASNSVLRDIEFNSEVVSVANCNDQFVVCTANQRFVAKRVVDTRPPPINKEHKGLVQCFYGEEVRVDADTFDVDSAQLMTQLKHSDLGIEFIYILPFGARHALIEFTCFSLSPVAKDTMKKHLHKFISDSLQHKAHSVLREESAILPMYTIVPNHHASTNYTYAGIAGGAMRAATGYSFLSSQRWAHLSAAKINNNQRLGIDSRINSMYRYMDQIMLNVLREDISMGVIIFEQIFKRVGPNSFARFMTERANTLDILAIIWAMPKRVFMRAAFLLLSNKLGLSYKDGGVNK